MSFAELPDNVVLDGEQPSGPAAAPAISIQPAKTDEYLAHVQALFDAGASKDQIYSYVRQNGLDPAQVKGLDEAITYRDSGGKGAHVAPDQPIAAQSTAEAAPEGFAELPADAQIDPAQEPETLGRSFGLAGRAAGTGLGQIADLASAPVRILDAIDNFITPNRIRAPLAAPSEIVDGVSDAAGLPTPQNNTERAVSAAGAGITGGLATAGAGSLARIPVLAESAAAQALGGGGAGAGGEIAKDQGAGPVGQIAASLAGGVAPLGVLAAGKWLASPRAPSQLLQAFQRQQVRPMADQVGGTGSRAASGIARMTLGGIPLSEAAVKSIDSLKVARDRVARIMGSVVDDTAAGQAAQRGARNMIETTGNTATRLYNAIPVSGSKDAVTNGAKTALADLNAGLTSNPELSGLIADKRLQAWEKALAGTTQNVPTGLLDASGNPITRAVQKGGKLSWDDLKAFRSYVGELAGQQTLQDSTPKQALQRLYAGLSEDMRATAAADGPKALRAFERANTFYRARQARIDNTLSQILGDKLDKSPEAAFSQIERWSRNGGDSAALARTIRSLPADEASTVRASVFSRLGNVAPGRQDISGTVFSPNDFATSWAKLDGRAKGVLFPGQEYRRDVDDIARIADSMKHSAEFANTSKTAFAGNGIGLVTLALAGHPIEAGGIAASQFAFGKLMASQRFARWLASAPRKPNGPATLAHINRLSVIAQSEPAIANEVLTLQQRLAGAFTGQPLAASPPEASENVNDGTAEIPQQKRDDGSYQQWLKQYGIREDPTYDTRAAFEAGLKPDARGHLDDTYKQPNHPTFSDESVHNGEGGKVGGKWVDLGNDKWEFRASDWNLKNMSKQELKAYFDRVEPGTTVVFPDGERYTGKGN